jgi:uncharacterized membrane protein
MSKHQPDEQASVTQDEETVRSLADIHEQHQRSVGTIQKLADRVTGAIGRPVAVLSLLALSLCWVGGNTLVDHRGGRALDPYPFAGLELFAAVSAFLVTLLILTTQRHEQEINRRRDQLTLHVALLAEKKTAKVIDLLEEMRRDSPALPSRDDPQASELAKPADPQQSLERIEATSVDVEEGSSADR